jgi:16S rRNA (cytosine1402-N4)-methyltransferase
VISQHVPVMPKFVLEWLRPQPGGRYVDGTLGGGGHTRLLLEASAPDGRVLALDRDRAAIERARPLLAGYGRRLTLVHGSFAALETVAQAHQFAPCDGVLLDLGLSSDQLAAAERGFSIRSDGPLDMRFDPSDEPTAADLLNQSDERELADIFYQYGEERRSRRLARVIVERRRQRAFATTGDLVAAVEAALGGRRGRLHPATRIFQALRIAVNQELDALRLGLLGAARILTEGGRLAVISFHSLEDRIAKQFVAQHAAGLEPPPLRPLTKKPLRPAADEVAANPRSRSAKLRVAERPAAAA